MQSDFNPEKCTVKQLSLFIENKAGRLADISEIITQSKIDIRALSIADTSEFGILRMITDTPEHAAEALKNGGLSVRITEVIAVEISDVYGSFNEVMQALNDGNVDVEYLYAFVSQALGKARLIIRVKDIETAAKALYNKGIKCLKEEEVYKV